MASTEPVPSRDPGGLAHAFGANFIWGLMPLFWPLLAPATTLESLAHRTLWAFPASLVAMCLFGSWSSVVRALRSPPVRLRIVAATALISVNAGCLVWGVTHSRVLEVSLGFFAAPLLSVALGVFVLGEQLRPLERLALAIAGLALVIPAISLGEVPWLSVVVAMSFAGYGFLKRTIDAEAVDSSVVETALLAPLALVVVGILVLTRDSTFIGHGSVHALLLVAAGPVTVVPLLLFASAARRLRLATLGQMQYLVPLCQFLVGVFVVGETMSVARWASFGFVVVALCLLLVPRRKEL